MDKNILLEVKTMPIPVNKVIIRESAEAEGVVIVDLSKTSATPLTV
jgi:hypothetical protein